MKINITSEIFSWKSIKDRGTYENQEGWDTPYKYLDLAQHIALEHTNPFQLIDLISNLNRSIDHRLKKLSHDYALKKLNHLHIPKDTLGKLEKLKIIRPTMLEAINSIRNRIEHSFHAPPPLARCQELIDFTWYFLKSTDDICRLIAESYTLNHNYIPGMDSNLWIEFTISPLIDWKDIKARGVIESSLLSATEDVSIDCEIFDKLENQEKGQTEQRFYFSGNYTAKNTATLKVIQTYFIADSHI